MDRIVVRKLKEKTEPNFFVVVEGNRRAAAFKGLINDYHQGLIELPDTLVEKAKSISVICIGGDDDEIEDYKASLMGVRHVSGPKRWSGYQSARLINELYNSNKSFDDIGSLLGITGKDAKRRMSGYRAFMQMRDDDDFGDKAVQKHYTQLLEFLVPSKFGRNWLGWNEDSYQFENKDKLHRLYSAMTGDENNRPEITNPTKARDFLQHLENEEDRKKIEDYVRLDELTTSIDRSISIEEQLVNILEFVSTHDVLEISDIELDYLNQISEAIQGVLIDEGGQ